MNYQNKNYLTRVTAARLDGHANALCEEAKRFDTIKERTQFVTVKQLNREIEACVALVEGMRGEPDDLGKWARFFDELTARAGEVKDIAHALEQEQEADTTESFAEFHFWIASLLNQMRAARRDFNTLIPGKRRMPDILHRSSNAPRRSLSRAGKRLLKRSVACQSLAKSRALRGGFGRNQIAVERIRLALEVSERDALGSGLGMLAASIERTLRAATELLGRTGALAQVLR